MKVALPDLPFAYLRGIASALKTLEDECELQLFMWNDTTPLMDVFDEIKPDLVICIHLNAAPWPDPAPSE